MKVIIRKGDHLPAGEFELTNKDKIGRAKKAGPQGATKREILIEYDKLGGRIVDSNKNVLPPQSFWPLEVRQNLVESLVEREKIRQNSRYGELVMQSNYIQYLLILLVSARATRPPTDKSWERLENLPMGLLIDMAEMLTQNVPPENNLIESLRKYKEARNKLAHKMFTPKRLTPDECDSSIILGEKIVSLFSDVLQTPPTLSSH